MFDGLAYQRPHTIINLDDDTLLHMEVRDGSSIKKNGAFRFVKRRAIGIYSKRRYVLTSICTTTYVAKIRFFYRWLLFCRVYTRTVTFRVLVTKAHIPIQTGGTRRWTDTHKRGKTLSVHMENEVESTTAALASSSTTERKWASFILLGPLLPSMFAIMLILVGEAVVKVYATSTFRGHV